MIDNLNNEVISVYDDEKLLSPEKYSVIAKEYLNELQKHNVSDYDNIKPLFNNLLEHINYILNFSNYKLRFKKCLYTYYKQLYFIYKDIFKEEHNYKRVKQTNINLVIDVFNLLEIIFNNLKHLHDEKIINLVKTLHNFLKNMLI